VGSILVGLTDTLGGVFLPQILQLFMDISTANNVGSSIASMAIYILMGGVLIWRPTGLYGSRP
ncbi:MAG: branched-chain amino acid ABC transporter permease, partial [Alphaproteobacteria bacterium]